MIDLGAAVRELQAGRWPAAEEACVRALAAEPDNADALGLLAYVRMQQGDLAGALDPAGRAIALRPEDSRARFNRAQIFEAMGDDARAAADYAEACRLDARNVGALINLGGLMLRRDRLDEAASKARSPQMRARPPRMNASASSASARSAPARRWRRCAARSRSRPATRASTPISAGR
jgi:Flp pilus assembly protein TadD